MHTGSSLNQALEPIANWFNSLGTPEPIVHWGHPVMMGIVVLVMGGSVAYAGWKGRTATDEAEKAKRLGDHRKIAPLMSLFLAMGFTGGILSMVMQDEPVLESPHFWAGAAVLFLLALQGAIAFFGFPKDKGTLRSVHTYLGGAMLAVFIALGVFGLNLGLSI